MSEEETINDVNGKLCDIANDSFAIREKDFKRKTCKKALRSLPSRFAYKVTAIREAIDLKRMSLEELMGSLQNFEIELNKESKKRKKTRGTKVRVQTSQ